MSDASTPPGFSPGTSVVVLLALLSACGARTGLYLGEPGAAGSDAAGDGGGGDAAGPAPSLVLFGGGDSGNLNDTWRWSAADGWTELHPTLAPPGQNGAVATQLGGGQVLFYGGGIPVNNPSTWTWNGVTWQEQHPASSSFPPPTLYAPFLVTLDGSGVLSSGYDDGVLYDDTWVWSGTTWVHQNPSDDFPYREFAAAATLGNVVVVFGGEGSCFLPLGDTWTWDGTTWTQQNPVHSPSPRRGAAAAALGGKVVLFGGDIIGLDGDWTSVDETWLYDGTDWTQENLSRAPPARDSAAAATVGDVVVLFGGGPFVGPALGDTWTWNGSSWTVDMRPGPSPRVGAAMAPEQ
jgi:hypothetical protein